MRVRTIVTEDFTNYYKAAMLIGCVDCDFKCCTDGGFSPSVCINNQWESTPIVDIPDNEIIQSYLSNPITSSIVFCLFEPFLQYDEMLEFIRTLRETYSCNDDIVIYTGYMEEEVLDKVAEISKYGNIIVKFGRFKPGQQKHYDDVLGVYLASDNQYARRIS